MQTKDFKGQDCRGLSFKGQDLTGADFSDCDLRGVDFSFANLTDAKFCNARMGRTLRWRFMYILLAGIIICFLIYVINSLILIQIVRFIEEIRRKVNDIHILIVIIILGLVSISVVFMIFKRPQWFRVYGLIGLIVFVFLLMYLVIMSNLGLTYSRTILDRLFGLSLILLAIWLLSYIMVMEMITIGGLIVVIGFRTALTLAIAIAIIVIYYEDEINMERLSTIIVISGFLLMGHYSSHFILKNESILSFIRNHFLLWQCWNGTIFDNTLLSKTNFSYVNLIAIHFKNAKFHNCNFHNAKNHHLALFENTLLEPRKVRDLVIDGIITDKNFATLDLRGLDFSNLNLQNFDFSHANLSGANLSHTQLTGATLEGWNIDTETCLDDIDCRYYYYLENGAKQRMPPEGEQYCPGEFTRIFQKIANTIDFIAHNGMELAAIKLSVEQVRVESGNDDIRVQAIEEKDGFIVVKVTVPKTEDRGVLYHEVNSLKQEYEAKIQTLTKENYIQIGKIETLREELEKQRRDLLAAIKPNIQIENSTFNNNGITNLGEINGNVSQQNNK
jgi:uncharacterized protein YjbI with pentapeptide repeats